MKATFFFAFFLLLQNTLFSQELKDFIAENAIFLTKLDAKNENLAKAMLPYRCIMIGEMHGTKETAQFTFGLIQSLAAKKKKIVLGIEIPAKDVANFKQKKAKKTLAASTFFQKGYNDGRNNEAWFELIVAASELKNVEICFFDSADNERDSLMSENLWSAFRKDTSRTLITLSGNIHNMLLPFRNEKKMGAFMTKFFSSTTIAAINFDYASGTILNNMGDGLKERKIEAQNNIFAKATDKPYFLLPKMPDWYSKNHNMLLFCREIKAALPLIK